MFPAGSPRWGWALSHLYLPCAIPHLPPSRGLRGGDLYQREGRQLPVLSAFLSVPLHRPLPVRPVGAGGALTLSTTTPRERGGVLSLSVTKANSLFPAHQLLWVLSRSFLP